MGSITIRILGIGIAIFSLSIGAMVKPVAAADAKVAADVTKGEALYKKHCLVCHGAEGKGDGAAADFLFPKPRNFTTGAFKIRSTPSGSPPTDGDLFRTITNGMPGSAMPSFVFLSEGDRRALVVFVKKLANITEKPERVFPVPPEPPVTPKILAQGKEVYLNMKCWECHGLEGRGDGPKAVDQKDDWGFPILPADYTRGVFKGGGKPSDIYMRFTSGVDGTPMPTFEDSLNDEERWALAHHVLSFMSVKEPAIQPVPGTMIVATKVSALPKNALDPAWKKAPETTIPLIHLWQGLWQGKGRAAMDAMKPSWQRSEAGGTILSGSKSPEVMVGSVVREIEVTGSPIPYVSAKAVHDGNGIAILLEWEDREINSSYLRHEDFTDGAAVMFSLSPEKPLSEQPHFTMGEKGGPVNIWYWRFDRQMDLGVFQDIERLYPTMDVDDYQLETRRYPKSVDQESHPPVTPAPDHDPVFITGWGAGNIVSIPIRPSAVEDLNAEGFGTLTAQSLEDQDVKGVGLHVNGRWKVVLTREFKTKGKFDVQFRAGGQFPFAFAIWNGSKEDRDGQKAVTTWNILKIE